jgi:hypothetical protein
MRVNLSTQIPAEDTMIHHMSIPAHDPLRVAKVLAELTGGRYFAFPVAPGAYMTIIGDAHGTAIEVLPREQAWVPGAKEVETAPVAPTGRYSGFHVALSVPVSREVIQEVGLREGWLVRDCDRGPFQLIELWVENDVLLELLTVEMAPTYLEFLQPDSYGAGLEGVRQPLAVAG